MRNQVKSEEIARFAIRMLSNFALFLAKHPFDTLIKVYQYLPAMVEYRKEQKKIFEAELLRKEAEARKLFGVKQPSDLTKQKEHAEKQKTLLVKQQNYKAQMAQYKQNPNKLYRPTSVIAMETIPVKCIRDGKYLLHLNNIEGKKGFCCLYCNTHYLIARKKSTINPF